MIQIEIPDKARELIYRNVMNISVGCEQFVYSVFQRIQRGQTDLALSLIDSAFNDFTESSKNLLQEITQNVLGSLFPNHEDSQGLSSNEKYFSNMEEGMRAHSKPSKLGQPSIEVFPFKQEIEEQMMLNTIRYESSAIKLNLNKNGLNKTQGFKDKQEIIYFVESMAAKILKGPQTDRFVECLMSDFFKQQIGSQRTLKVKPKQILLEGSNQLQQENKKLKNKLKKGPILKQICNPLQNELFNAPKPKEANLAPNADLDQQNKEGNNAKIAEKDPIAEWKTKKLQQYKEQQFLATEELRSMLLNQFCSLKVIQLRKYLLKVGKGFRIMKSVANRVRCAFNKLKLSLPNQGQFINSEQNRDQKQNQQLSWSQQQKYYNQYDNLYKLYNCQLPFTNEGRKQSLNRQRYYRDILNKQKLLEQFEDWWLQLQKLSWNFKERCFEHKLKIQYLRLNEAQKYKKYLCTHCIQNQREGPNCQIVCVSHFKPIKYKLQEQYPKKQQLQQSKEGWEEQQIFLCEECHLLGYNKYSLVCGLHCQNIVQLCIQQQCIEADEFTLCPACQQSNRKHALHRKITFNTTKLMERFAFKGKVDTEHYSKDLLKAKEMLQIQPLEKIRKCYTQNVFPIMSSLESFTISNNEELSKWVDLLINQGKKEALTVLKQMMALNQENFTDSEKQSYLEAFNYLLQGELSAMFEGVWQRILHSCERINKLKNANKSEVIAELNKKYEQISDIETGDGIIVFPMRLSDVNPIHRSRIQRITVVKESEAQRDDKIRKEFRDKRGKFFKQQIRRKLIEAQVGAQQQREIIQLFSNAQEYQLGSLAYKLQEQNTLYKYRTTIESLSQTYKQIKDQFAAKLRECLPWSLIVSNEFSSLRVLRIQYAPKYYFIRSQIGEYSSYLIDAFALFGFISGNAQLEQVALKGVFILYMQQFVETLNPNNPDPYSMREREKKKWLKARRPWTNLKLTLQSAYQLHSIFGQFKASTFAFHLSALSYFRRQFQSLSGMTVVIRFQGEDWGDHLEGLLQCLREIKEIKIEIIQFHKPSMLLPLLKGLSSFTEITSLAFQRIQLQPQKSGDQFPQNEEENIDSQSRFSYQFSSAVSAMEKSLSLLFKGNAVAHLRLDHCRNFPALPRITTLRSIDLFDVSFWGEFDLGGFVKVNRQLRLIRIEQQFGKQYKCEIGEETFNQLQYLNVDIRQNGVCFGPISSPSPSKLKYLSINNGNIIDANSLKPLFAKLAHLTQLSLWSFDFGYQLLSAIPSNSLEELYISVNNTITDVDLQLTDCKQPYLREIELRKCPQISERMLRLCKFKGLIKIQVDGDVLSLQGRKHLRGREIRF